MTEGLSNHDLGVPLPLNGRTRLYAILGDPIAQAGSPGLFNRAFKRLGLEAALVPMHIKHQDLNSIIQTFRAVKNFDGLVVTVPHKIALTSCLDEIGKMAQRIGAVNAIRKLPDGRLLGDNFDGAGFIEGLRRRKFSVTGKSVLIAGAGGAGRAVAHSILDEGPSKLAIFDTDTQRTAYLCAELSTYANGSEVTSSEPDAFGYDVIVNCTSVGMKPSDPLPFKIDRLNQGTLVVDIILEPALTPLLQKAHAHGCAIHQGFHMLDGQIDTICRFFGLTGEQNV